MPVCSKCGLMAATVEMRRSPKKTRSGETLWLCKSQEPCKARRREARKLLRAEKKGVIR